jgi:hypothetical protein
MQVLASQHRAANQPSRRSVASAVLVGASLLVAAAAILYLVFGLGFLERFVPTGRATTFQLVAGALAWTFALTAPAGFGLVGVARLANGVDRARARRPRVTPVMRLARAIGDDHIVATNLRLPDGSRIVPEIVIGPFGAAVIEELPPAGAVLSRGVRTWEVRAGSGAIRTIENPLERASRDAERVRAWLTSDDQDYLVKVYAVVVGTDDHVQRTPTCAFIRPDDVAVWLSSLAPQASLDEGRRDRIVRMVRAAL